MSEKRRSKRHAVLIVHGIGEQVATDTAHSFARALVDEDELGDEIYFSPGGDEVGSSQRMYKINWSTDYSPRGRYFKATHTDVVEGYWAPRFRDTAWNHLTGWLMPLILAHRSDMPDRLSGVGNRGNWLGFVTGIITALIVWGIWADSPIGAWVSQWLLVVILAWMLLAGTVATTIRLIRGPPASAGRASPFRAVWLVGIGLLALWFVFKVFPSADWPVWAVATATSSLFGVCLASLFFEVVTTVRVMGVVGAGGFLALLGLSTRGGSASELTFGIGATLLFPLLLAAVGTAVLPSMGAAARYLRDHPENEEENRKARAIVINKLKQLTSEVDVWGRLKYERITVIGHSLGSVIAYDALIHFWAEVNEGLLLSMNTECAYCVERHKAIEALEEKALAVHEEALQADVSYSDNEQPEINDYQCAVLKFRQAQWRLGRALSEHVCDHDVELPFGKIPERWIISDLVTVGSPLSSIDFLKGSRRIEDKPFSTFHRRREEREYPTCPPTPQTSAAPQADLRASPYPIRFPVTDLHRDDTGGRLLHHAAVFASTRWTNVYFEHDVIGGPVSGIFGRGILDVCIEALAPKTINFLGLYPHSSYWETSPRHTRLVGSAERSLDCFKQLIRRPAQYAPNYLPEVKEKPAFHSLSEPRNRRAGVDGAMRGFLSKLEQNREDELQGED